MTTFDELKDKALQAAGNAADAAKQLALISKCRLQIAAEQEKIRSLYTKLGKLYYKDYVTDEEPDEAEYRPLCDGISEHYQRISRLRSLMDEAKNNFRDVKKKYTADKTRQDQEEDTLIALVSATEDKTPTTEEDELLEELNNLNNNGGYGEILE